MRKFLEGSYLDACAEDILGSNAMHVLADIGLTSSIDIDYETFNSLVAIRRSQNVSESSLLLQYKSLSVITMQCLTRDETTLISDILKKVFTCFELQYATSFIEEFTRVQIGEDIYVSEKYRGGTSPNQFVMARFQLGEVLRPCIISSIFKVKAVVYENGNQKTLTIPFVKLKFMKEHPLKYYYGRNCPMLVWNTIFEDLEYSFAPLCCIVQKCVTAKVQEQFNHIPMYEGYNFRGSDLVYFVL